MLQLKNLNKTYKMPGFKVEALKDINLSFRKNEFVSILGPSGSGKTTLLNIIGGLDNYDDGDLIINGRKTKDFKEKDWNIYRNHRIGFVFQSYNLIPHQTVLSNVELALTIAGLSKEERIQKAKDALDKVGLHDQYDKKPNQLSGGQSQRVAIARALVNDPEILLADEPTGALDTVTSKQIMDLIKEIASDRLVIMVTHNPDLAEEYSTRIINLLDGEILDDSNPYKSKTKLVKTKKKSEERAKMSWWTTFKLSIQNLLSKKNRSILTSIASSIGIIGISLVLSLSFGVQLFIKNTQEDMLSGNPILVEESAFDMDAIMAGMSNQDKKEIIKEVGHVTVDEMIKMISERSDQTNGMFVENNITREYIEYLEKMPEEDVAAIFYDREIDISNNIYLDVKESHDEDYVNMSMSTLRTIYTAILKENDVTKPYANLISSFTNIISQAPNNPEYIESQYNILDGKIATEKNEIMLVLNKDGLISDLTLAQLGFYSQEEFINKVFEAIDDDNYNEDLPDKNMFSYEELKNKKFMWYPNDTVFKESNLPPIEGVPTKEQVPFLYNAYKEDFEEDTGGMELEIVGILEPKEEIMYGSLESGFYYTEKLADYIIENNYESEIVNYLRDKEINGFNTLNGMDEDGENIGVMFFYSYNYLGEDRSNIAGFVGEVDPMSTLMGMFPGDTDDELDVDIVSLTMRHLGGKEIASKISIYPVDLKHKDNVIEYLDAWNDNHPNDNIVYMDALSIVFTMINDIIKIITIALIGFTSLALFVSSVMIAIITYVSVVERIKEIGVIRSLGGSKRDVSNLFIAETVILGTAAGIIAIAFTYLASFIVNLIVYKHINSNIAVFPIHYALLMLLISITLTLISGLIPSRSAARKDPVKALRTE